MSKSSFEGFPIPMQSGKKNSLGPINSIQRIVNLNISGPTTTQTISAVDPTKTVLMVSYSVNNISGYLSRVYTQPQAKLLDSTTVQVTISNSQPTNCYPVVQIDVIEFKSAVVKSLQSGEATWNMSGGITTINAVDRSKSLVFFSYYVISDSNLPVNSSVSAYLASSTQLVFNVNAAYVVVQWYVVEFY